ncbi:hypothetical protein ABL849_13675 [Variovorax sp. 375MFSha3.1]|uniref:hypothetical protein n=1 Tax=Variovorax sp. 375MFSha3.1 TaxID=3158364 RepID=UPI003AAC1748
MSGVDFEYILKVVALGSAIFGAWYAVYNFDSWRREHQGKRQAELAEETLALFYEASDIVNIVRSPMSWGYETDDLKRLDGEMDEKYQARKAAYVVFKRLSDHHVQLNKLYAMRYRFMAAFGAEKAKPFTDFHDVLSEIRRAGHMLSHLWARRPYQNEAQAERDDELIKMYENVFWEMLPEDDKIKPKVASIVKEIETTCRGVIEAKSTLYGVINKKFTH